MHESHQALPTRTHVVSPVDQGTVEPAATSAAADGFLDRPTSRWLSHLVLWGGAALRFALAAVNGEANDDHLPVIRALAFEHRFLKFGEAWEAFQPKLYYLLVAPLFAAFDVTLPQLQARVAQLVSAVAGIAACYVVSRALDRMPVSPRVRVVTLALVVFNPAFVGISAMATNDAVAVLMGTLALVAGRQFFDDWRPRQFAAFAAAVLACCLTKGTGLVLMVGAGCAFGLALWTAGARVTRTLAYGLLFAATVAPATYYLGPYASIRELTGSALTTNWPVPQPPSLVKATLLENDTTIARRFRRPGVRSVVDGVLTFRIGDMLRYPSVTGIVPVPAPGYPRHVTSLWSQVYGQAHFSRFAGWPETWRIRHAWTNSLGRGLLVLALVPTAVLTVGLWSAAGDLVRRLRARGSSSDEPLGLAYYQIVAFGYIAFLATTVLRFRDAGFMKPIYVYPGLLAFAVVFARQCAALYERLPGPRSRRLLDGLLVALALGYVADLSALGGELALWVLEH